MPIIGKVERKNWKVRLLNVMLHVILLIGAATMVYPLLLMLSGSVKSDVDFKEFTILPEYLSDSSEGKTLLFRKYLFSKYNGSVARLTADFKDPAVTFDTVEAPQRKNSGSLIPDYEEFLQLLKDDRQNVPHYFFHIGMTNEQGVDALSLRNYRTFMQEQYSLRELNQKFNTQYETWDELNLPSENFLTRRSNTDYSEGILKTILDFKYSVYADKMTEVWPDLEGDFAMMLHRPEYGGTLQKVNQKLGTNYNSWSAITLPATVPAENPALAEVWIDFVKSGINLDFVRLDPAKAQPYWQRYLKRKYKTVDAFNLTYALKKENRIWDFSEVALSPVKPASGVIRTDWQEFISANTTVANSWQDFLKKKYGSIRKYNEIQKTAEPYSAFSEIVYDPKSPDGSEFARLMAYNRLAELPADAVTLDTLAIRYREWLKKRFSGNIHALWNAYATGYETFDVIDLPDAPPGEKNLAASRDWIGFVNTLPPEEIHLARQSAAMYRNFLTGIYSVDGKCDYEKMSEDYGFTIKDMSDVPAYTAYPANASEKAKLDYVKAVKSPEMAGMLRLDETQDHHAAWIRFLKDKYGGIAVLNHEWQKNPRSFDEVTLPTHEREWNQMKQNTDRLNTEYLTRNYTMVFNTLFTNGDAAVNTLIYCLLSVLAALLINPLCAYGLSRYKPASSYKILLFLMLPMAFPGMVLGIPQFLLVKDLGLLNTFAALILPGIANGYSIFLLKGFFDSLPKELFESAAIDGASEWTVFWQIAMRLSTPILSVIALGSFTAAYGNFMLAFLLCQDKSMWTMMVYLYQLQQRTSPAVGFAALVVAAIPTLIVFIFCQNIIIKGIVVPTEK